MSNDGKQKYTSGVGVAATRREKAAMTDEVNLKAVNRMFAILTLFLHPCQLLFSFRLRIVMTYRHQRFNLT